MTCEIPNPDSCYKERLGYLTTCTKPPTADHPSQCHAVPSLLCWHSFIPRRPYSSAGSGTGRSASVVFASVVSASVVSTAAVSVSVVLTKAATHPFVLSPQSVHLASVSQSGLSFSHCRTCQLRSLSPAAVSSTPSSRERRMLRTP